MLSPLSSYHLLINKQSGGVLGAGEDKIRNLIANSGLPIKSLNLLEPAHIAGHIGDFTHDNHPILIGGGDGTIAACLPYFIKTGHPLGILPLGTMNLLARDLGFSGDLGDALAHYAGPLRQTKIDVAYVNGRPFLCCAGLGTMPESAVFREHRRGENEVTLYPKLIKFIFEQMDPEKQRRISLHINGRKMRLKTAAIVISNNRFMNDGEADGEAVLRRGSLRGGKLGVYSFAPRSWLDKLGLMMRLRFGGWKNHARLREWQADHVLLDDPEREELVSVDGEVVTMTMPLRFHIEPQCLSVMVPGS